jgi:hypothetical protein
MCHSKAAFFSECAALGIWDHGEQEYAYFAVGIPHQVGDWKDLNPVVSEARSPYFIRRVTYVDLGPPLNPSHETLGGRTEPESSLEDRLRHAQNMYDQHLINKEEYTRLRSEILHELSPTK